jgi:predicted nuclease of restriction endonuclease-like (RecB) superfamily
MSELEKKLPNTSNLVIELSTLIDQSKQQVAKVANSALTILFWHVGKRIHEEILNKERAEYGKQIITSVSVQLEAKYGRNFTEKNVRRMIRFFQEFSDFNILPPLAAQLSWSHFIELFPLKSTEAKLYYAQNCIEQNWGKRELRNQIQRKAFERTEIANLQFSNTQPDLMNTFKDPYVLDFLHLKNTYLEHDIEKTILQELETFVLELGKGFAFMERQKRMVIDGDDFYLDLLFYNRTLKRLVAIELKLGKFEAAHKGQMELYLKWLNKYEKQEGENEPIGLILCAESNKEQVELLEMHKDGIMVSEYLTVMPPKKELEAKLHQLLVEAKERIERNKGLN